MKYFSYTTAPEEYDYGYSRTRKSHVATTDSGKVVRLVEHEDLYACEQQRMRYGSGMYIVCDADRYREEVTHGFMIVKYDDWTP